MNRVGDDLARAPTGTAQDKEKAKADEGNPTGSVVLVRVLVEALGRAGVPRDRFLEGSSIAHAGLDDASARVDVEELDRLQQRALDLTGDEQFGLRVGSLSTESSFDLLAHVVAHAPTVREAMALLTRFTRLLRDGATLRLDEEAELAAVTPAIAHGTPRGTRLLEHLFIAGTSRLVTTFCGSSAGLVASFAHPRPDDASAFALLAGVRCRFDQPRTRLVFPRSRLDVPQLHRHPALFDVLHSEAERTLHRLTSPLRYEARLREHLLTTFTVGTHGSDGSPAAPSMAAAARTFGMSARSLRRRLADEGVSFRDVAQAALQLRATRLLDDRSRTLQEVSHALGFSDAAAFHRAFKRWTGHTPTAYRERNEKVEPAPTSRPGG